MEGVHAWGVDLAWVGFEELRRGMEELGFRLGIRELVFRA